MESIFLKKCIIFFQKKYWLHSYPIFNFQIYSMYFNLILRCFKKYT